MDARTLAQVVSLLGAGLVLVAYGMNQMGKLDQRAYPYLALNLAGGAILTIFAVRAHDPGLILMEGSWVAISAAGLVSAFLRQNRKD
jgi:hypothetical protein